MTTQPDDLARRLAGLYEALPETVAVALGGSRGATGLGADASSDVDLYVYTRATIPLEARRAVVATAGGAVRADMGLHFWGDGDEWVDAPTGIHVDAAYFDTGWMEGRIDAVLDRHEASLGYTTSFWHTVLGSIPLADRDGWLARLCERSDVPYPEGLRTNIVAFNRAAMRGVLPSYANQIGKAAARSDLVSVNHRLAGLLASYFDVVFAVNRATHPGEKRLVEAALRTCPRLPDAMASDLEEILRTATTDLPGLPARVDRLLDRLDALLAAEGFTVGSRSASS